MMKQSSSIDLLEKTFDSKRSGDWEGRIADEIMFADLYIKRKYDKLLYIHSEDMLVLWDEEKKDVKRKKNVYYNEYSFGVHSFVEPFFGNVHEYNTKTYNDKIFKEYFTKMKNTKKRFTVFMTTSRRYPYYHPEGYGHSILFLYDKKYNEVELFDSGPTNYIPYKKSINHFFKAMYNSRTKIIYPGLCKNISLLESYCEDEFYKYKSKGFCVTWSLWYLDMRLKNPSKTRDQVISKALKEFETSPNKICRFIRGYSQFVDSIVKNYSIYEDKKKIFLIFDKRRYFELPRKLIKLLGLSGAISYFLRSMIGFE